MLMSEMISVCVIIHLVNGSPMTTKVLCSVNIFILHERLILETNVLDKINKFLIYFSC